MANHFMANRWGNSGNSGRLYFLGAPKSLQMVTAAMKLQTLTPWRKVMTNLDSILKSRVITLPTKVCLVKAMVFPVVMYGCESWTMKNDECRRIDAFELWCWRRLLRVPWTGRRSIQSALKGMSPEYSFEGLMLKLKLQYFGHLMRRVVSLEKTLMLGGIGGRRRRGRTEHEITGHVKLWLSVRFSCSVMFDSLQPYESQHARPPCPSPTPGVHSDSHHRVGDAIQPSHPLSSPFPPAPNPSQHQSLFQCVNSSHEVTKVLEFQL